MCVSEGGGCSFCVEECSQYSVLGASRAYVDERGKKGMKPYCEGC